MQEKKLRKNIIQQRSTTEMAVCACGFVGFDV